MEAVVMTVTFIVALLLISLLVLEQLVFTAALGGHFIW